MFLDGRDVPEGAQIDTDVCVVGAGAAGITIAKELLGAPFRSCLLESGGLELDMDTQSLYGGRNAGFPYFDLDVLRLRFFGGTTNHWAGACRPLDEIDFESRSWVPKSGWPLTRKDLDPFYATAHRICELGAFDYTPVPWESALGPRLPLNDHMVTTEMELVSPTLFGRAYRNELEEADAVTTYLHSNLVDIELDSTAREVIRVRVACLSGTWFWVRARFFVLATGAIENARLLLASNGVKPRGVGNEHSLVGRFFMEHVNVVGGILVPSDPELPLGLYSGGEVNGRLGSGFLAVSPAELRAQRLTNVRAYVRPTSVRHGLRYSAPGLMETVVAFRSGLDDEWLRHIGRVIRDVDDIAMYSYRRLFSGMEPRGYYLMYHIEQAPNPESRITLSSERDALGLPRVVLTWRFGDLERRTLRGANEMVARAVGEAGLGRVMELPDDSGTGWPSTVRGNWHQMGTTRMSEDPRDGVVDAHCMVHATENLFVAGSSVFPTSGYTNPTLTIVALAVRIAGRLKELMAAEL